MRPESRPPIPFPPHEASILKIQVVSLLLIGLLASCEKPEPTTGEPSAPKTNPTLAASQLALAKSHIEAGSSRKALPYLEAAIANGSVGEAEALLTDTLAAVRFTVPVTRFTHPFPVLSFTRSETSLFAAIGGPHPTVVRWDLTETPQASAVLFPAGAEPVSHLSLSPSGNHLLVHRGGINLLCLAETLKPIANLGAFPAQLDPTRFQPFSENSLLLANPTADDRALTWHIRDSATGEILRSESFPPYPKPLSATFLDTTLLIDLEDQTCVEIPLTGETRRTDAMQRGEDFRPQHPSEFTSHANTITRDQTISLPPSFPHSPPLLQALTGLHLNPISQSLEIIPAPERLAALSETFPDIPPTFLIHTSETLILNRLAAAFPDEFPELSAASRAHAQIIRDTFATGDPAAIKAAIRALPPSGLPTATALFLAIGSINPEFIELAFAAAEDLPPAFLRLRDGRNQLTPDDLASMRKEQDWLGYESPDFSEILDKQQSYKSSLLASLTLPENPTEADIMSFFAEILSPESQASFPRETLAGIAINAALTLARDPDLASSSLQLTAAAERLGTPRPVILRTRANAFTSLADFKSAHRDWIDLITNQPEAAHLASDYSEAAYTAFENGDPRQAIEILNTGLFRFPNDTPFAIRAGWIALITDHPDEALICLTRATKLGLPPAEIENTTALLAITHSQLGDPESAASYLAQLKAISPKWADPENTAKLPWPAPLRDALHQIISLDQGIEPEPELENDPTDTAPQSGEFPIPEPPLPSR